jgi:polysaccharide biosynthesis/export protein
MLQELNKSMLFQKRSLTARIALSTGLLGTAFILSTAQVSANTLSAFDRISVAVINGEEFSSARGAVDEGFLIGEDGQVFIPQLGKMRAAGREESELQSDLVARLREYIRVPSVSVRLVSVSPVSIDVSGAVYRPGNVTLLPDAATQASIKDVGVLRTAFNAIRKAGGVRPDANLAGIEIEHEGKRKTLALGQDTSVITGDRIIIPSLGAAQTDANNVPSQLAPSEISVYVSGQDLPPTAIGAVKVKPGTPLSGALTAAGATGQSFLRSDREVVLIRGNPTTGKRDLVSYRLDKIVTGETDPKLLQDDSILVNAGAAANTASFLGFLAPIFNPLNLLLR